MSGRHGYVQAACTFVLILLVTATSHLSAESFKIPARQLAASGDNIVAADPRWDGLVVCYGQRGMQQWNVDIARPGVYYIHFRYASGAERPVRLFINEQPQQGKCLARNTGGYFVADLSWDSYGPFQFKKGSNAIRITSDGFMPHLAGLIVSDTSDMQDEAEFDALFPKNPVSLAEPINTDTAATRARLRELLPSVDEILFVRRYTLQSSHYYTDFIDGCRHFGGNLCALSLDDGTVRDLVPRLSNGILGRCDVSYDGTKVVFDWKEKLGVGFRIWEVGIDGTGLRQLTFPPTDEVARIQKYQLDLGPEWTYKHHTDDMHPCYLPDGSVCFVSSRCEYGILCDGPDKLTTMVLYRMDADGRNIQKLSNNPVTESAPSVTNDGRVLYTRWEYVDNGTVANKGLWTVRPDGSETAEEVYGMNIAFPSVFHVARAVPGCNHLFVAIGAPHMPLGVGTLMLVDSQFDRRTGDGVKYVTPEVDARHQWGWDNVPGGATKPIPPEMQAGRDGRGNTDRGPLYMDPYPLSEAYFLVSFNPSEKWNALNAYGLYLIDVEGHRDLLWNDTEHSCWMPIPIRARAKPPALNGAIDEQLAEKGLARVAVSDIHRGLDHVPRGTIKYIRINEHVPRPGAARRFWAGDDFDQQHSVVSCNANLGLKIQHGIVPVEEDGSAHFLVEADKNIFFQVLDQDHREVQRERTFVNFRPGEVRSCVGYHERASELASATMTNSPLAMQRAPDLPGPQPGEATGARPLAYEVDVQPVWDRHCVRCHGGAETAAGLDLSGERTTLFNRSYENIMKRKLIAIIGENHPKTGNAHYLPPYSLGTHASELRGFLSEGHYDVRLTPEERIRVTTWIDSNGQYHGSYYGRKNLLHQGHANFRPILSFEQSHANTPPIAEDQR